MRQATSFRPENKAIAGLKREIVIEPGSMGGKIDQPRVRYVIVRGLEIGIRFHPHIWPIIQARALEQFVGNTEAERFDKI